MQIGKILFPVTSLGPGKRLGIWVQGCNRFCAGCANPELQIFDPTKDISPEKIFAGTHDWKFDGLTISGGEPFLQVKDLKTLVELYIGIGCEDILIYTGFTMQELVVMNNQDIDFILSKIAVLIDGPFVESLVDDTPLRGSSNQNVWILNAKYKENYEKILQQEKKVDIFCFDDDIHFIGIPFEGYDALYKKLLDNRRKR